MSLQRVLQGLLSRAPVQHRASSTPVPRERLSSPVPWIADEVWTSWIDPDLDQPYLETLVSPAVIVVSDEDRRRSTPTSPDADKAGRVDPEDAARCFAALQTTPSSHVTVFSPLWPICCGDLSVLINAQGAGIDICEIEAAYEPLDHMYLEHLMHPAARSKPRARRRFEARLRKDLQEMRRWGSFGGLMMFRCGTCGRHYVSTCTP